MNDWITYLRSIRKTDIWGHVFLDYFQKRKELDDLRSPAQFLHDELPKLINHEIDVGAFHRVLVCVSVQLLGDDFEEVFSQSLLFIKSLQIELCEADLIALANHYSDYGKKNAFLSRLAAEGRITSSRSAGQDLSLPLNEENFETTPIASGVKSTTHFGIVVALPVELDAILLQLGRYSNVQKRSIDNRTYYLGELLTEQRWKYRVVVTLLPRMGNIDSALATSEMIQNWKPRYVLLAGIAGGTNRATQNFGDVVIAESVFGYDLAKIKAKTIEIRPRVLNPDPLLYDRAKNFDRTSWLSRIPRQLSSAAPAKPRVVFGPIASGDKVIASPEFIEELKRHQPKLLAVEMESAGAASAAFLSARKTGFLTVRSISDFADSLKNDDWHSLAASAAAAWTVAFLESGPVEPRQADTGGEETTQVMEGLRPASSPLVSQAGDAASEVLAPEVPRKQKKLDKIELFDQMRSWINSDQFKTLCFYLDVDPDNLPGDSKDGKVRELIKHFDKRGELGKVKAIFLQRKQEM